MDNVQLITFERIVREGSFSRAALALDVSQAAVSGRIQALEEEIGAPLFIRGGRRVTLTGAGEAFLPYARRAIAVLAEGMEAAAGERSGRQGRVTVGSIDSVADGLLVPVVARFQLAHPAVILSIRTGHTPQIVQELADGTVRVGIVTWGYVRGSVDHDVLLRLREPLIAVAAPRHPLARVKSLTVAELVRDGNPYHETAWGTPEDTRIAGSTQRSWVDHELPHGLMRGLIAGGHGAGFLPETIVAGDIEARQLVALPLTDGAGLARDISVVAHASGGTLPPATRGFVDAIRDEATRLRLRVL